MKKLLAGVLTAALVFGAGTTGAFAAGPGRGRNFTDAKQDGIRNSAQTACSFTDADGDGICDTCGVKPNESRHGKNFIDEDGDGICDNYSAGTRPRNGTGRGCRGGRGR